MIALLRFHLLQVWRSKLLILWLVFSFFVQWMLAKLLHSATVEYQGVSSFLGVKQVVTSLIFAQYYTASVLAVVYGIWIVPYLHEGGLVALTYCLPVRKAIFPLVYMASFTSMLFLQAVGMFVSIGMQFGWSVWAGPEISWTEIGSAAVLLPFALNAFCLGLAVLSIQLGKVIAFLCTLFLGVVLQGSAVFFQMGYGEELVWRKIYKALPPLGEIFFALKNPPVWDAAYFPQLGLWVAWLAIFALLFRVRLGRPG